jgi:hypothetical protein
MTTTRAESDDSGRVFRHNLGGKVMSVGVD